MAENTKHCGTCKYGYLGPGYEPCKSCGDRCDKWEPQDGVIPIPMDINKIVVREEKKLVSVKVEMVNRDSDSGCYAMDIPQVSKIDYGRDDIVLIEDIHGQTFIFPHNQIHYIRITPAEKED